MNVRVKLLLQGGHVWQFRCDEDDPLIFGLVSALPGADAGANMPPDGLIQVETASGERLFLTRSSLVSLEIRPVSDGGADLASLAPSRTGALPSTAVGPAPFALLPEALPTDLHSALLAEALAREFAGPVVSPIAGARELDVEIAPAVIRVLETWISATQGALGVPDLLETHLAFRVCALGDRGVIPIVERRDAVLTFTYTFHRQPKVASGGGMRLFDTRVEEGVHRAADTIRDVEPCDNALLIVPGSVVQVGLPLRVPSKSFSDSVFVVHGSLRRGMADG